MKMHLKLDICTYIAVVTGILLLLHLADGLHTFGSSAVWREKEDSVKRATFIVNPTEKIETSGTIIGWNVYTVRGRRSQMVHLQVWRKVNAGDRRNQKGIRGGGANTYRLIGQTIFVAHWVGHSYVPLYPADRIEVEPGDVLGMYFPKYNPIPWNTVPCSDGSEHLFRYNPKNIGIGNDIGFVKSSQDWKPCRVYSFNATIADKEELDSLDYEDTTFPNNRGYHGQYSPTKTAFTNVAAPKFYMDKLHLWNFIFCIYAIVK